MLLNHWRTAAILNSLWNPAFNLKWNGKPRKSRSPRRSAAVISHLVAEMLESRVLPSTFPQVLSIVPINAQFTTQAKFNVTFSTNVTGVDASDFVAVKTGVGASSTLQVAGSGSVYTVTVNNLTGTGTLGVNLVDNSSIRDGAGNPLVASNALYTFGAAQNFAVGSSPSSVAIGNLNSGGKPDLVVSNKGGNTVSFLLGNGNGTFVAAKNFPTESSPNSVVLFDMNSDTFLDAVTANQGKGSITVVGGNGAGISTKQSSFPVGNGASSAVAGDINGDTHPDLVLDFFDTNTNFNSVVALTGDGNTSFTQTQAFASPGAPAALGLSDVNADGHPDLLIAHGAASNTVSVMLGNGDGTFSPAINSATGSNPSSVTVGDLNGDSFPDLIVSNKSSNSVSVLFGHGDGTFDAAKNLATSAAPLSVAAGDLNGDGRNDLAIVNNGANTVSVRLATSNGNFVGAKAVVAAVVGSTADTTGVSTAPDVNSASSPTYTFTVQYMSRTAVNASSIKNGNVTVTGPNGFSINPLFVSVNNSTNGTPRTATYQFTVPTGSWRTTDNGVYTIKAGSQPAKDTSSNSVSGTLGTFVVNLPFTFPAGTTHTAIKIAAGKYQFLDSDHGNQLIASQSTTLPITINGTPGAENTLRIERSVTTSSLLGTIVFNGGTGGNNTLILDTTNTKITQSPSNLAATIGQFMFNGEQTVSYGGVQTVIPIERMYRIYNTNAQRHIFTSSPLEFTIITANGLQDETTGQPGWAVAANQVGSAAGVFRLYNPNTGEHYYTLNSAEKTFLITAGLHDEGLEGFLFATQVPGSVPIFRLYNQVAGEHLYTESASYRDAILAAFPGIWVNTDILGFGFAVASDEIPSVLSTAGQTASLSAAQALSAETSASNATGDAADPSQPTLGIPAIAPESPDGSANTLIAGSSGTETADTSDDSGDLADDGSDLGPDTLWTAWSAGLEDDCTADTALV